MHRLTMQLLRLTMQLLRLTMRLFRPAKINLPSVYSYSASRLYAIHSDLTSLPLS